MAGMGQLAVLIEKWQAGALTRAELVVALLGFEYQPDDAPPLSAGDWGDVGGFGGEDTFYELLRAGTTGRLPADVVEEVHERLWAAAQSG